MPVTEPHTALNRIGWDNVGTADCAGYVRSLCPHSVGRLFLVLEYSQKHFQRRYELGHGREICNANVAFRAPHIGHVSQFEGDRFLR